MLSTLLFSYSPLWSVVPEVAKLSPGQQPVKIAVDVLETAEVDQSGVVVGRVLVDVHDPLAAAGERCVARAGDVATRI